MTRITSGVVIHLERIGVRHWRTTQSNGKHSQSNNSKTIVRKKDEGAVVDRHTPIGRITQTIYNRAT